MELEGYPMTDKTHDKTDDSDHVQASESSPGQETTGEELADEPVNPETLAAGRCPDCHSPLPAGFAVGLCPVCLFQAGLDDTALDERIRSVEEGGAVGEKLHYVGDYELTEEVGRGGMGVVYRATQSSLGRPVAVKLLLGGIWASEHSRQRFQVEARAAAAVQHPGIVNVHEVGEHEGQPYFSMDLVDGEDLGQYLRREKPSVEQAVRWLVDVADAVATAHEHGVTHRDLKPSNVIIDWQNRPVLTDFGLARMEGNRPEIQLSTLTGQVFGTPGYIAPERLLGRSTNAAAEDLYALGALLYALLTRKPPHDDMSSWESLRKATEEDPKSPRRLNPEVPKDLEAICLKALARKPEDRYGSVRLFQKDLERFLEDRPVEARPIPIWVRTWRQIRRRPGMLAAGVLIAFFAALALFRNQVTQVAVLAERQRSEETAELLKEWTEVQGRLDKGYRSEAIDSLKSIRQGLDRLPSDQQPISSEDFKSAVFEAWRLPSLTKIQTLDDHRNVLAYIFSHNGERLGTLVGSGVRMDGETTTLEPDGRLQIYDIKRGRLLEDVAVHIGPHARPGRWHNIRAGIYNPLPAAAPQDREGVALVFDPHCGCLQEIPIRADLDEHVPGLHWVIGPKGDAAYRDTAGNIQYLSPEGNPRDYKMSGIPVRLTPSHRLVFFDDHYFKVLDTRTGGITDYSHPQFQIQASGNTGWTLHKTADRQSLWSYRGGGLKREIPESLKSLQTLSSHNGQKLAVLNSERQHIRIYEAMESGPEAVEIPLAAGLEVRGFYWSRISPDGRFLALTGRKDSRNQIQIWRLSNGEHLFTLWDQHAVVWSPDSRRLVTRGHTDSTFSVGVVQGSVPKAPDPNFGLNIWQLSEPAGLFYPEATARRQNRPPTEQYGYALRFLKHTPYDALIAGRRWIDIQNGPALGWRRLTHGAFREYREDARYQWALLGRKDVFAEIIQLPRFEFGRELEIPPPSPSMRWIVDQPLRDIVSLSGSLPEHPKNKNMRLYIEDFAFDDSGQSVWTTGSWMEPTSEGPKFRNFSVDIWDAQTGRAFRHLTHDHMTRLIVSPKRNRIATIGQWTHRTDTYPESGGVAVWDAQSGEQLARLPHTNFPHRAAWTPNGEVIFSGDSNGFVYWSRLSSIGREKRTDHWHTGLSSVQAIAVDASGDLIAVGDDQGHIQLWSFKWSKAEKVFAFEGHPSAITALDFHPDTGQLASGDAEGRLRLWDLENFRQFEEEVWGSSGFLP